VHFEFETQFLTQVVMSPLRRDFLLRMMILAVLCGMPQIAVADKGSGGDGSSDSGSSGSDSSGSGSDEDDDGTSSDDDNSGSGKDDDDEKIDQDDARDAVKSGAAMPLRKAMKRAKEHSVGRIIDVSLMRKSSTFIYVFTVVKPSGEIEKLKMDAVSGRFSGLLGF
jgi:hypothetical protein